MTVSKINDPVLRKAILQSTIVRDFVKRAEEKSSEAYIARICPHCNGKLKRSKLVKARICKGCNRVIHTKDVIRQNHTFGSFINEKKKNI